MSKISNLEGYRNLTPSTKNSKVSNTRKYKDVREREYLTTSEIERISKAAKSVGRHGHRDSTITMVAYHHALRVLELVNLKWSQVDLTQGLIHGNRLKNGVASVHSLSGQNIRALRKFKRDYSDT